MFYILDRYIGKIIFNTIIMTLFMLVSLSGIIKFIDQLRKVGQGNYSILSASLYTLLSVPKDIEVFFPMASLLGALLGLGAMASHSELVVMQASGFSRIQVAVSVMKTAIPLVLFSMVIGEFFAPNGEQMARNYRTQMIYGGSMLSIKNGLWVKEGNDFIFIERAIGSYELSGVNIYHFDESAHLQSLCYANTATFTNGVWRLSQVDESNLSNRQQIIGKQTLNSEWKTNLTPDKLNIVTLSPDSLSVAGLYQYVKYLRQSGQESSRYQLNMWSKMFSPFSVAIMMLMALSFIFGPLCSVPIVVRVVIGIIFGFLFYVLGQIFGPLSIVYNMPPILGAILPSSIFIIISITLLRYS